MFPALEGKQVNLDVDARRGPQAPVLSTPPLRPGLVRRTTTIDLCLPPRGRDPLAVKLVGRDLVVLDDGSRLEEHQSITLALDAETKRILAVESSPERALDELRGASVGPGFRRKIVPVLQSEPAATLLYSLLDQLPGMVFLSGYTAMLDDPPVGDSPETRARFASRVDTCSGYTATGTIGLSVAAFGRSPVPRGPEAPPLAVPLDGSWHHLSPLPPLSLRRARRIDVSSVHGGFVDVDAMFRDINVTRDSRSSVLHEYELKATIDARSGAVASVDARPRVLPWQECPAAMGSAARIVGVPVAHLRQWVGENLGGATTCTHLNEALRVLEDIGYLLEVGRRSTLH